jgi:glycosyltransferase involved in cell wall biosynthesis
VRVTVLMAVNDGERYVMHAVESVLAQTFPDFELLVVDDASTDATPELLATIGDPRVRVLRNDRNLGQVPSLNRGLREARGEIVARVDADDWCRSDRLERQVAVLDAEPEVAVVGSWATIVDGDDCVVGSARQVIRDFVDFVYLNLIAWVQIPHPAAAFRREVVLELGGYDTTLGPSEDKDLWRRMALARHEARNVEAELIRYRVHDRQLSRVRALEQARHDERSHLAFLRALAGEDVDVARLRLLLTTDPRFFSGGGVAGALADLDALLTSAAERLRLSAGERARLRRLVRARVSVAARRGWHGGIPVWWLRSGPVAGYGLRGGGRAGAVNAAATALLWPLAVPARVAGSGARAAARVVMSSGGLRRVEASARRSALARRVYSWLIRRQ